MTERKPEHLRIVEGNPGHRRQRKIPRPRCRFGKPPAHLAPAAKKLWRQLVPELEGAGLAAYLFRTLLEGLCVAYSRMLGAEAILLKQSCTMQVDKLHPKTGAIVSSSFRPRPEVEISRESWSYIRSVLKDFGLSPFDLGKLDLPEVPRKSLRERLMEESDELMTILNQPRE